MTTMGYLHAAREWMVPTLKKSAFLEKGVLTPDEFVKAGDELVYRCPTWCWETGDPSKIKSYLPKNKQFLMTRNVPCQTRVAVLESQLVDMEKDDEDDWMVSHLQTPKQQQEADDALEEEFDILDETGEVIVEEKPPAPPENEEEEDEYADMADFEDDNVLQDDDAAVVPSQPTATTTKDGDDNTNIVKVRTYDLSITYDKYYQTPRVWMMGKQPMNDGSERPLSGREMMQDVMSDYANKTVTIEAHPHVTGPHASIHPCQHGKVMKTIVQNLLRATQQTATDGDEVALAQQQGPSVEMYLFIFLKFVSSIIPTINYDFTMDVTASTKK